MYDYPNGLPIITLLLTLQSEAQRSLLYPVCLCLAVRTSPVCFFPRCLHCLGYVVRCTAEKRACLHLYKQMLHAVLSFARETTANYPALHISRSTQTGTNSSVCVLHNVLCQNAFVILCCLYISVLCLTHTLCKICCTSLTSVFLSSF